MDLETVTETVFSLERELDLFEDTVDGVHYWERVRFPVHRELRERLDLIDAAHDGVVPSKRAALARLVRSAVVDSPFLAPSNDLLVYGHERRKHVDGEWWDIYCDPLLDDLDRPVTYFEQPYQWGHRTPAHTEDVRHLDLVVKGDRILRRLRPGRVIPDVAVGDLRAVEERFEAALGVRPDVVELVDTVLRQRAVRLPLFSWLLRRVDPELVVLVVSYSRETFIEACRRHGVPTVELQHGVISPYHLGYSYPDGRPKRTFPDYFLSFGEFWGETVEFPLPDDRLLPVGYPFLERRVTRAAERPDDTRRVVFVSQGTIGEALSQVAAGFAATGPDAEVVYKLHPGEDDRWRDGYPWLREAAEGETLRVVGETGPSLYELFERADAQVGVYSTALYEGLQFGLDTYLVDRQGVAYMDDLVARTGIPVVADGEELAEAIAARRGQVAVDTTRFFRPNALANVRDALDEIARREGAAITFT